MSVESVETIISRAVTEPEYRELLFNEPDKALEGYELTEEEAASLKELEREKFDAVLGELEDRISRGGIVIRGSDRMFTPQPEPPGYGDLLNVLGLSGH